MRVEFTKYVDSALFGSVFDLHRANKAVQVKIDECSVEQFEADDRLKHSKEDLDAALTRSVERLERIENKAMGTLLGVAAAIAVLGAASGVLGSDGVLAGYPLRLRILAAALLFSAMLYLFGSGFLALGAYKVGQVYRPTLLDRVPIADLANEAMVVLYCIDQNHRAATLRSNRLLACFTCLRNGLAMVLVLGTVIVIVALVTEGQSGCLISSLKCSIEG